MCRDALIQRLMEAACRQIIESGEFDYLVSAGNIEGNQMRASIMAKFVRLRNFTWAPKELVHAHKFAGICSQRLVAGKFI